MGGLWGWTSIISSSEGRYVNDEVWPLTDISPTSVWGMSKDSIISFTEALRARGNWYDDLPLKRRDNSEGNDFMSNSINVSDTYNTSNISKLVSIGIIIICLYYIGGILFITMTFQISPHNLANLSMFHA